MNKIKCLVIFAAALAALTLLNPQQAEAFCGFYVSGASDNLYNDATQVVLMRDGKRTILSMQNHYDGPPEDFAMVVPVPVVLKQEDVKTLPHDVFKRVDLMASPRLVEYWEQDPCMQIGYGKGGLGTLGASGMGGGGGGKGGDGEMPAVKIEAQFEVGEYEVVVLSATDSMALDTWLRKEKYNIPEGAAPAMRPYIESGMFFFVAKVNLKKVKREGGRAVLSPLRFHYDTETFQLPVRLGLLNARGPQDLIVHILANQRYAVANMPNVTIPTNIDVKGDVKSKFPEFYAALFDKTLEKNPGSVVTEYAWSAATCDPCPGPTLTGDDLFTLGADVLPGTPTGGFVLTRLHARYTAEQLRDDLVFAAASPIQGGREVYSGTWGNPDHLEHGATSSSFDNFQGRYIIRYPWTGEIACENPQRGLWGGPPGGLGTSPAVAQDTAFAPRTLDLSKAVASTDPTRLVASDLSALPPAPPAPPLLSSPSIGGRPSMPSGPRPILAMAKPTLSTAGLDPNIIRRVIARSRGQLIACYNRELTKNPAVAGIITIKWTILDTGKIGKVSVESNTTGNDDLANCVMGRIKIWAFPAPTDGASIEVTYPFKFQVSP